MNDQNKISNFSSGDKGKLNSCIALSKDKYIKYYIQCDPSSSILQKITFTFSQFVLLHAPNNIKERTHNLYLKRSVDKDFK